MRLIKLGLIMLGVAVLGWLSRHETIPSQKGGVFLLNRWTGQMFFYDYQTFWVVEQKAKERVLSDADVFDKKNPVSFDDIQAAPTLSGK